METVKSRSESPFSRNKTKSLSSEPLESENSVNEQIKRKKKILRNKVKSQTNGKETTDLCNNGKNYSEEDMTIPNEIDNNVDSNSTMYENGVNNGDNVENENKQKEVHEVNDNTENDALVNACDNLEEKIDDKPNFKEIIVTEEYKSTEITTVSIKEDTTKPCSNSETEEGAKQENVPCDVLAESEVVFKNSEETCSGEQNEILSGENNVTQEPEANAESSEIKELSLTGSDISSNYEEANANNDHIQASPDTATKDDYSFSKKIPSFLGKWNYSQEQKQDPEISSSKKTDEVILNHPYLSKVSGRRGIKDRLNSSASVFSLKEIEAKTPENSGKALLDDSFRVRTNPPRFDSLDLKENPTLRKFKGKRCLNAGDDPEENDIYISTMKRRKLDENAQESGLFGSIFWSPFKKKSLETEIKLTTKESKLSRFLSPFWFWKKIAAATGQKEK